MIFLCFAIMTLKQVMGTIGLRKDTEIKQREVLCFAIMTLKQVMGTIRVQQDAETKQREVDSNIIKFISEPCDSHTLSLGRCKLYFLHLEFIIRFVCKKKRKKNKEQELSTKKLRPKLDGCLLFISYFLAFISKFRFDFLPESTSMTPPSTLSHYQLSKRTASKTK